MYNLLDLNKNRLAPWFWWANTGITKNKMLFYLFMVSYLTDTKYKEIAHALWPFVKYDKQFIIHNDEKQIIGMCGLDNIDTTHNKNAELWYLTFKDTPFGIADEIIQKIENYSINTGLTSLYAKIQSTNDKSIKLVERNNFTLSDIQKSVHVSARNNNIANMYTYKKQLVR
ncbi:MAG: GNAT family N-acetyltransferase [Alphaproteobacteria bacterium]|nr:GNAT family N-acetyltransferase [Alphaproteobacteria bacterium]